MNILAVDCSLKLTCAALSVNGSISGNVQEDLGRSQTALLAGICQSLMNNANLSWNNLDYVAITNGPGYFTGIRVGAAYASGIAYASGAKLIPVSTLDLLTYIFRKDHDTIRNILTVIYAGHGFVYAACDGVLEPGEYSHAQILSWLHQNPDTIIISDNPKRTELDAQIIHVIPDAVSLSEIAENNINIAVNPAHLNISYFRPPQGVH